MFGKKQQEPKKIVYGGNFCPPPPARATEEELAESAGEMSDILTKALELLSKANELLRKPVADSSNERSNYAGYYPRFPLCGEKIIDELFQAQGFIIEANKMAAVQGYTSERNLRKEDDGN